VVGEHKHSNTKQPLELIKDLILKHSKEGAAVLDCFGGQWNQLEVAAVRNIKKFYFNRERKDEWYFVNFLKIRIKLLDKSKVYK
jgi:DNA modification methylase